MGWEKEYEDYVALLDAVDCESLTMDGADCEEIKAFLSEAAFIVVPEAAFDIDSPDDYRALDFLGD